MFGTTTPALSSTSIMRMEVGRDLALAVRGPNLNAALHFRSEKNIMHNPMNIHTDGTLVIKETSDDFFGVLLPVCTASILANVIDPSVPWVSLIGFRSNEAKNWTSPLAVLW